MKIQDLEAIELNVGEIDLGNGLMITMNQDMRSEWLIINSTMQLALEGGVVDNTLYNLYFDILFFSEYSNLDIGDDDLVEAFETHKKLLPFLNKLLEDRSGRKFYEGIKNRALEQKQAHEDYFNSTSNGMSMLLEVVVSFLDNFNDTLKEKTDLERNNTEAFLKSFADENKINSLKEIAEKVKLN